MLADYIFYFGTRWSRNWGRSLILFALGIAGALVVRPGSALIVFLLFVIVAAVGACFSLPLLISNWWGFRPLFFSAIGTPIHAVIPVSYQELSRLFLKIALFRTLVILPLFPILGLVVAWQLGLSVPGGALLGAKILVLTFLFQPIMIASNFSRATHDGRPWRIKSFLRLGAGFILALSLFALAILSLLLPNQMAAGFCLLGFAVGSFGWHAAYGWTYNRCWFDTMAVTATPFSSG
jgi:hypothetical protein